jgi:beta-1,4-mannosyl-glycoprotein beta-1,4-N-acetylglucosaminyltransferase
MRIIDCFPYNGDAIAAFRLAYLADVVDEFIVVEARETFSGIRKDELWLDRHADVFKPYAGKVTRLVIDPFPPPGEADMAALRSQPNFARPEVWFRELYQRNFPAAYLLSDAARAPWIVLSCDVDEIPRREVLAELRKLDAPLAGLVRLEMAFHYYGSRWVKPTPWYMAVAIDDRNFRRIGATLDSLRRDNHPCVILQKAGWHFSYFMNTEEIVRKVCSFSHQELNNERTRSPEWVRQCVREGRDLFGRGQTEDCIPYPGHDLPEGIQAFEASLGI